jgi:hypothetical protein
MSDDGYGGGAGGDDYDYGGPSFAEDAFVCPYIMFPFNSLYIFCLG